MSAFQEVLEKLYESSSDSINLLMCCEYTQVLLPHKFLTTEAVM